MVEKIGAFFKKWVSQLFGSTVATIDARLMALVAVMAVMVLYIIPPSVHAILKASAQFSIAFFFAVALGHLARKILLQDKFNLTDFWLKAKEDAKASAYVFAATLAFTAFLIDRVLTLVAIKQ